MNLKRDIKDIENSLYLLENQKAMLTLEIDDANLEQKIIEKARSFGKTAQQFLKDLVIDKISETEELGFEIPHLDYRKHIKIIDYVLTEEEELAIASNPDVKPFSHIKDSAKYVHDLRNSLE